MKLLQRAFDGLASISEHRFDPPSHVDPIHDRSNRPQRHAVRHPIEHPRVLLIDALEIMLMLPGFERPGFLLIDEARLFTKHDRVWRAMLLGATNSWFAVKESALSGARPRSPYGITKKVGIDYLAFYQESRGIDFTTLAFANVYGPRQDPLGEAGVVSIFASKMLAGESPTVYGDGNQTRDYVYIDDVVNATLYLLSDEARYVNGANLHLSGGWGI